MLKTMERYWPVFTDEQKSRWAVEYVESFFKQQ